MGLVGAAASRRSRATSVKVRIAQCARSDSAVLGVTITGSLFAAETKGFPPSWRDDLKNLPKEGRLAYADALHVVYVVLLGISIAAAICEVSIPRHRLRGKSS